MTVNRTTLLDLPLPVTGTESGTWGDTTNNGLTQYLDIAIAGSLVLSADSDTTLSSTEGDSSATNIGGTTAQYAVLRCTGARTATRNINAPAWTISGGTLTNYSKIYIVVNETTGSQNIVLRATNSATPTYTTGVTIVPGERAVCAWNGSDFVKVGGAAGGSNTQVQYNNNGVFGGVSGATTNGTAITFSTTNLKLQGSSTGVSSFASANSSASDYTYTFPAASTTIPVATQTLTFSGPTAARTITLPDANFTAARTDAAQTFTGVQTFSSNPVLSGGTANGVLYLNGSSAATSGSALTFDGTNLVNGGNFSTGTSGLATYFRSSGTAYTQIGDNQTLGAGTAFVIGSSPPYLAGVVAGSEQMRLTSTGLGIGTSSPSAKLDVAATEASIRLTSTTGTNFTDVRVVNTGGTLYSGIERSTGGVLGPTGAYEAFFIYGTDRPMYIGTGNSYLRFGTNATERARITSGGNLGVGTTNPGALLEVLASGGSSAISARYSTGASSLALYIYNDGTNAYIDSTAYGAGSGGPIVFRRNGSTESARITSGGNVGIGTSSPDCILQVEAADGAAGGAIRYTATGVCSAYMSADPNGLCLATDTAGITFRTGISGNDPTDTGTERARINSSGTFFIGNGETEASPSAGILSATGGTGTNIAGANLTIRGGASTGTGAGGVIIFSTAAASGTSGTATNSATERARITSGGYFKASNNGTYDGSTGTFHEFYQSANDTGLFVRAVNASLNVGGVLGITADRNTTNNTFYALSYYNNGAAAYKFRVADSGDVTNTSGTYGQISDAKMKTDIVDASSQWADIKAIRFRKFKMKDDPSGLLQLGVVAQELEQTSPGLVDEHVDRDAEGNDLGTTTKSVKTSILLMKAAKALQEAMTRIETLEAKVAALEGTQP